MSVTVLSASASIVAPDRLAVLAAFALSTLFTPGPNNLMLASSGARFGYRETQPHAFGVALGFPAMLFLIALGLGGIFQASALLREGLRLVGAALMLYIAWKIATASRAADAKGGARPFTFFEAAAFQWVNPKAWMMSIGVAANFMIGDAPLLEAAVCAFVFAALGVASSQTWTGFGAAIRGVLSTETRLRAFNVTMGVLMAGCVALLFLDDLG